MFLNRILSSTDMLLDVFVSLYLLYLDSDLLELELADSSEITYLLVGASGKKPPDVLDKTEQALVLAQGTAHLRGHFSTSASSPVFSPAYVF